jgi:hypothetical protein
VAVAAGAEVAAEAAGVAVVAAAIDAIVGKPTGSRVGQG